jgi:hypothetical protein
LRTCLHADKCQENQYNYLSHIYLGIKYISFDFDMSKGTIFIYTFGKKNTEITQKNDLNRHCFSSQKSGNYRCRKAGLRQIILPASSGF